MAETTLPARLRAAAEVLEELSALAGFPNARTYVAWSADSLRRQAALIEQGTPA